MSDSRHISLRWTGEGMAFDAGAGSYPSVRVDGRSEQGPSPMELLLGCVAGCMAIHLRTILEKGRVPLSELEIVAEGERAQTEPRRFVRASLHFRLAGPAAGDEPGIARAIQLAREKYCSVLHSLDPDLPLETSFERI